MSPNAMVSAGLTQLPASDAVARLLDCESLTGLRKTPSSASFASFVSQSSGCGHDVLSSVDDSPCSSSTAPRPRSLLLREPSHSRLITTSEGGTKPAHALQSKSSDMAGATTAKLAVAKAFRKFGHSLVGLFRSKGRRPSAIVLPALRQDTLPTRVVPSSGSSSMDGHASVQHQSNAPTSLPLLERSHLSAADHSGQSQSQGLQDSAEGPADCFSAGSNAGHYDLPLRDNTSGARDRRRKHHGPKLQNSKSYKLLMGCNHGTSGPHFIGRGGPSAAHADGKTHRHSPGSIGGMHGDLASGRHLYSCLSRTQSMMDDPEAIRMALESRVSSCSSCEGMVQALPSVTLPSPLQPTNLHQQTAVAVAGCSRGPHRSASMVVRRARSTRDDCVAVVAAAGAGHDTASRELLQGSSSQGWGDPLVEGGVGVASRRRRMTAPSQPYVEAGHGSSGPALNGMARMSRMLAHKTTDSAT